MFNFLNNVVQFFPFYSVMTVWFPDECVYGKLEVIKCILENISNSVHRKRSFNGGEMHNRFRNDLIEDPGDRKQRKAIL